MGKFNYFNYRQKRFEKLTPSEQEDLIFDLVSSFSVLRSPVDAALFLRDLLTEDEVRIIAKRLRIAKLLLAGGKNEEIVREMHCSFATVTKVRMWIDNAGEGLRSVIHRLPKRTGTYQPKKTPGIGYTLPQILLALTSNYFAGKEKKQLQSFLEEMRVKTSGDRDFKESLVAKFRDISRRRK